MNTIDHILKRSDRASRKKFGQFFTDPNLADHMAALYSGANQSILVIDPGSGTGVLTAAFLKRWGQKISVKVIAYETDPVVLPYLKQAMESLQVKYPSFTYEVREENYVLAQDTPKADFIICNPPYIKIGRKTEERARIAPFCSVTNLYAAFMAKSICDLKTGGELVYLVPRSWTSGFYFTSFREYLRREGALTYLVFFQDRRAIFSTEKILQDVVIVRFQKGEQQRSLPVCCFWDNTMKEETQFHIPESFLCWGRDKNILLPSSQEEVGEIQRLLENAMPFESSTHAIHTGTIVQFRAAGRLYEREEEGTIPFITGDYLSSGDLSTIRFIRAKNTERIKNQWLVLIRRISPKEMMGEFCCRLYDPSLLKSEWIGIDLNVCYIPCCSKEDAQEIIGVLERKDVITFHRAVQSSNQISVRLFMELPWPQL